VSSRFEKKYRDKGKLDLREALIRLLLRYREGLASKRGLIDGHIDGLSETTVGGNDITNFECDHIPGNEHCGFNLNPATVTLDLCLGSKRVHECLDGISGTTLLVKTDTRVDEQEKSDTNEILPIRRAVLSVRQDNSDERSGFHNPGKRIPHETQKLKRGHSVNFETNPRHQNLKADLKKWVLLLLFEFVGTKNLQTTPGLFSGETLIITLEERKDIFDDDCLKVNFFLVIEIVGFKLDLCRT
jgi:hypothetical protein